VCNSNRANSPFLNSVQTFMQNFSLFHFFMCSLILMQKKPRISRKGRSFPLFHCFAKQKGTNVKHFEKGLRFLCFSVSQNRKQPFRTNTGGQFIKKICWADLVSSNFRLGSSLQPDICVCPLIRASRLH
jgi:hypothetical protein